MLRPYDYAQVSFQCKKEIGQAGKNSTTFIAHDPQLDAEIVIKKIEKSSLFSVNDFFEESRILYLSSHPNVVEIHYACQDQDHIYIAMPFYKEGSLKQLIDSRFLTVREIVTFGCQICSGLHNIHSKKLIHFDVKPDNVLLSDRNEALLSDFGQAKRVNALGRAQQPFLYALMIPPEVLTQKEFTPLFDIYQLGLTLYRMCNGNAQFYKQVSVYGDVNLPDFDIDGFKKALHGGKFPDRGDFYEHIPQKLRQVIKKCTDIDPSKRYQDIIEVANDLAGIEGKTLDWHLALQGDSRVWKKTSEGKEYTLVVENSGSSHATKKVLSSGNTQRITEYCNELISRKEIKKFLGSY